MIRIGSKALLVVLWILLAATPAIAGRIFVDVELGQGWLSPGGFPTVAVADTVLMGIDDFQDIDSAVEFGGRLGYRFSESMEAGFSYTRQNHDHVLSDSFSLRNYDFPASMYEIFFSYCPWQSSILRLDVGATGGLITTDGKSQFSVINESPVNATFSGESFLFSGYTTAELILAKNASLLMRVGYRSAKISDLDDEDGNAFTYEGDDIGLDFSGLFTRVGLRFYIN
jgi:hypothetical protein